MKPLLEQVRDKVPKSRNFHEVKRAFNKISAPLKIKVVQGNEKKRKIEIEEDEIDEKVKEMNGNKDKKKKKKKKNKGSNEAMQKKKEKKKFDLEDQYKNIEMPSFKHALVDNINNEEGAEVETPKKKKKKVA